MKDAIKQNPGDMKTALTIRAISKEKSLLIYGVSYEIKTTDNKIVCINPEDIKMTSLSKWRR